MKKIIVVLTVVFAFSSFGSSAFSAEPKKIMYVDLFKVFNEYQKTEEYDKVLEDKKEKEKKDWEDKQKKIDELTEKAKLLSDQEKQKQAEKIKKERQELLQEKRSDLLDLRKERDQRMEDILKDIEGIIEEYAKKNKIDLVVKKAAVVYGDSSLDKTQDIIKMLNRRYKK